MEPIKFKINLSEANSDSLINLHWPRTGIKGTLDAGATEVVCVLCKINPIDNTGSMSEIEKLKIELKWKINEQKVKQIAHMQANNGSSGNNGTSALRSNKGKTSVKNNKG